MNKSRIVLIISVLTFILPTLRADIKVSSPPSAVLVNRPGGFFSMFFSVVGLVYAYDRGVYKGVKVDFGDQGYYYSPEQGNNWWQYYFEPISLGSFDQESTITLTRKESEKTHNTIRDNQSRHFVKSLIDKYIHFRPYIQTKIDTFVEDNYKGSFVIGVHFRGTDKKSEAPRVPYEWILAVVNGQVEKLNGNPFKIFVATDETAFLDFIRSVYPDNVCCIENASRSTNGRAVHTDALRDSYKTGEEALLDCVLLSKTDVLIRTSSNLSQASAFFNPDLRVIFVRGDRIEGLL